jgi:hypothetical protein
MTYRQVRADFSERDITVYQAYSPAIADAAVAAGRFVAPFKRERMTWIKPSFLWMMYRCGWAAKPGQERVLAIEITRAGFEWALAHASLSSYEPGVYDSYEQWEQRKLATPVRVQWDPERSLRLEPLAWRSIQVGLSGSAARQYVQEWITGLADITPAVARIRDQVAAGDLAGAGAALPAERPYPLPSAAAAAVGASPAGPAGSQPSQEGQPGGQLRTSRGA